MEVARYNVSFSSKQDKTLQELADHYGISKAEALRRAIALLAAVEKESDKDGGTKLAILNADGTPKSVLVLPE